MLFYSRPQNQNTWVQTLALSFSLSLGKQSYLTSPSLLIYKMGVA